MTDAKIEPKIRRHLERRLPRWFARHRRDLPWRRDRSPYRVTVSEFMLQQTQVTTVIPYFERWMRLFPDWSTLAQTPEPSVLKAWEGLGYYSRARNLHHLAQVVMARGGELPSDVTRLRTLPGIGPYTAGAIASLAFGQRAALVDGNVLRVFARLFNQSDNIARPAVQKKFWRLAESLLPEKNCGMHNEALMELGATICTPQKPQCLLCPLQSVCQATAPEQLPVKTRTRVEEVEETLALIRRGQSIWCERPAGGRGRLAAFWKLPVFDAGHMTQQLEVTRFTYGITKYRVRLTVVTAVWKSKAPITGEWLDPAQVATHSFPAAHRKAMKALSLKDI